MKMVRRWLDDVYREELPIVRKLEDCFLLLLVRSRLS